MKSLLSSLATLLPLFSCPWIKPLCDGEIEVSGGNGTVQGTIKLVWHKDAKTGKVSTTLPPHFPGGSAAVDGHTFTLPANPTNTPMQITIEVTDPVLVQVPTAWVLTSSSVTTPIGTGAMVITSAEIPAMATISPTGAVSYSTFYKPEAGHKLYMGDYPPGLAADGPTSGVATFMYPPGPGGLHLMKFVSAAKITVYSPLSGPVTWYPPFQGITDFALVNASTDVILADTLDGTVCKNSLSLAPTLRIPADWHVGKPASLVGSNFVPSTPVAIVLSVSELAVPFPLGPSGCKLRVDPTGALVFATMSDGTGAASLPLTIPPLPVLIGRGQASQAAEFNAPATLAFTNHLKTRIEK